MQTTTAQSCCIALGGNQQDVEAAFRLSLDRLNDAGCQVVAVSSPYRTRPMGKFAGNEFLNAAAVLETELPPRQVLAALHRVESAAGRERSLRWGPRMLDLDLLLVENEIVDSTDLVLPHPAMWYRRFVLDPLAEIAADTVHPVFGMTIARLQMRLRQRPLVLEIESPDARHIVDGSTTDCIAAGFDPAEFQFHAADRGEPRNADAFARVVVADSEFAGDPERTQPAHPRDFVIRIPRRDAVQAVRDILSATLG